MNKLAKIKSQVAEVKDIMMENIERVLDRGGKIEILVEKTDSLRNQVCLPFYILPFFPCTYTHLQEL
jgi:uncharacterized protein